MRLQNNYRDNNVKNGKTTLYSISFDKFCSIKSVFEVEIY